MIAEIKYSRLWLVPFLVVGLVMAFSTACDKDDDDPPLVVSVITSNAEVGSISPTVMVTLHGSVEHENTPDVSGGFRWSTEKKDLPDGGVRLNDATVAGDGSFSAVIRTGLDPERIYYYAAFAEYKIDGEEGTAYGDIRAFATVLPPEDPDGNTYEVAVIGNQVWMAENLRTKHFANGKPLGYAEEASDWVGQASPMYTYHTEDHENATLDDAPLPYGMLYNWYAVDSDHGLCPSGWRVPADEDWKTLEGNIVGGTAVGGKALKSTRFSGEDEGAVTDHPYWITNKEHRGTDRYFFNALPGGYRYADGTFDGLTEHALFWTSTDVGGQTAWRRQLYSDNDMIGRFSNYKTHFFSVRCIKE